MFAGKRRVVVEPQRPGHERLPRSKDRAEPDDASVHERHLDTEGAEAPPPEYAQDPAVRGPLHGEHAEPQKDPPG